MAATMDSVAPAWTMASFTLSLPAIALRALSTCFTRSCVDDKGKSSWHVCQLHTSCLLDVRVRKLFCVCFCLDTCGHPNYRPACDKRIMRLEEDRLALEGDLPNPPLMSRA